VTATRSIARTVARSARLGDVHTFTPATLEVRGVVLLLPGGGQDHTSPGIIARALRLNRAGFEVPVVRSLDSVPALLADHDGQVGLLGVYAGAHRALTLLVAEPRVVAAVLTFSEPQAEPLTAHPVSAALRVDVRPVGIIDRVADEKLVDEQVRWLERHLP
jgi:hypothetical protein